MATGSRKLELAKRHLDRVQAAWTDPTDWDDLSLCSVSIVWRLPLKQRRSISSSFLQETLGRKSISPRTCIRRGDCQI